MIKGIDISHLNDHIDVNKAIANQWGFIFIKASQGLTYQDQTFQSYWQAIKEIPGNENGELVKRGGYHFFNPQVDGIAQAKNYLSRGIDFSLPGVLPPVIDVEDLVGKDEADTAQLNKWVLDNYLTCLQRLNDFLTYVEEQTGKSCIIYTYNNYPNEYYRGYKFPDNLLWLSSLQASPPNRYDTGQQPTFWQYTYRLNNTDLDGDYFLGPQSELDKLANVT